MNMLLNGIGVIAVSSQSIQEANPGLEIQTTIFLFAAMAAVGIATGFFYDFFRALRKASRKKTGEMPAILVHLQDLIFLLCAFCLFLLVIYVCNDGAIRGYMLLGCGTGLALYYLLLSPLFGRLLFCIFYVALLPVNYLLIKPGKWIGRKLGKAFLPLKLRCQVGMRKEKEHFLRFFQKKLKKH